MNILVTGGSGFIGSHVVDKLIKDGHKVRVLDLEKPYQNNVEFFNGGILSKDDIKNSLDNIAIVYHFAAFSNIDLVKANPLTTIEHNILGTAYLLDECRRQGIKRFIFASSVMVNDERGHLYTTSKLASEMICKNYNTLYSLPYTILRCGTAYGPRSRDVDVVSVFVRKALKGENLVVHGSGEGKRHFVYVEDLAQGSLAALKEVAENESYVLADTQPVTIKELAMLVKRIFGNRVDIEYNSSREDDYAGEILDTSKAKKELGWEPKVNLDEGIERYIGWYKEMHIH
ncbi:NAD-dependent epimerase/dehydratase family protein [Chloroflexota bacterium]